MIESFPVRARPSIFGVRGGRMRAAVVPVVVAAVLSLFLAGHSAARAAEVSVQASASPTSSPSPEIRTTSGWYGLDRADTITIDEPAAPGRYPAVIFIHGGAWGRSQPTSYEFDWARQLAQQEGWLVAVIGYPAKVRHEEVVEPYAIATAIHAVASRGDVDDRAIALWGESAGAQLALLAAYRDARSWNPLVSAVVSISGPTNMVTEYNSLAQVWLKAVTRFEGMTPQQAHDAGSNRYPSTSPADIVTHRDPPTFQAISRADPLVPSTQVQALTDKLASANVPHQTVWLNGKDHSTAIENEYPTGSAYTVQQLAESFIKQAFAARRLAFS